MGTPTPTCDSKCSPECRTEHNRGSRKYAACDLLDFSPEGMKRIMKYSYAKRTGWGCATVPKKRSKFDIHNPSGHASAACTSCKPGWTLFITAKLRGTGYCRDGTGWQRKTKIQQVCTGLDSNSGKANSMANYLCTKLTASSMDMHIKRG